MAKDLPRTGSKCDHGNTARWPDRFVLWVAKPALIRALENIRVEKETGGDFYHTDSDCGFELIERLNPKRDMANWKNRGLA